MGYESRLTIVFEHDSMFADRELWCEQPISIQMSKCDDEFINLFNKETKGYISAFPSLEKLEDNYITEDAYGKHITCCDAQTVYEWLDWHLATCRKEHKWIYHRYVWLFGLLKGLKEAETDDLNRIMIYHYGY